MPTIKDVARAAGVSHQTVSKVINKRTDGVRSGTRAKVEAAIEELGYAPNMMASRLRSGRSMSIGVLLGGCFGDNGRYDLARLGSGIGQRVEAEGYFLTQIPQCGIWDNLDRVLKQRVVDGLVLFVFPHLGERFREETWPLLEQMEVPVCVLHFTSTSFPCINAGYNIRGAGQLATQHLLGKGRTRIACIGRGGVFGEEHWDGYRMAMEEAGQKVWPRQSLGEAMSAQDGLQLGRQFLAGEWNFDGCVFSRDAVAYGFMKACVEKGIRIPEDLAVVGCDNLLTESYHIPELTTVDRRFEEHGMAAADLLFEALKRGEASRCRIRQVLIAPRLIERRTSG